MVPKHSNETVSNPYGIRRDISFLSERPEDCREVGSVLSLVGDKWSVMIIMVLGDGPRRFSEIKRAIGGVSQRMLTLTLRGLERDGLVTRTQYATIPPRVDYDLTALGHSLWQVVEPLGMWASAHLADMKTARDTFDTRDGGGKTLPRPIRISPR